MQWNKQNVKWLLLVIFSGIAFFCALQNLRLVFAACKGLIGILAPFLLGGAIAFILNVPMRAIERYLAPRNRKMDAFRRPLSLLLTLLAFAGVIGLACNVIGPGIKDAVLTLAEQLPHAYDRFYAQRLTLENYLPQLEAFVVDLNIDWNSISQKIITLAQSWGSNLLSNSGNILSTSGDLIGSVVSALSSFVIGLIFSFYLLFQKEKLSRQGRQVCYALLPTSCADRVLEILRLSNRTFSSFLSGQCLEAVILGTLFVVAMTLIRLPYALLVGVLISLTALIPIVGAFIGCGVGALLIAITDPWKALIFIVLFLILQQIEGNLIYPHVVGSSVGLPSIWVLAAVTLGGSLMGVVGMLLFIPLCSVLYAMFRGFIKNRLIQKSIPESKWQNPPQS